jgi:hypothetical protein
MKTRSQNENLKPSFLRNGASVLINDLAGKFTRPNISDWPFAGRHRLKRPNRRQPDLEYLNDPSIGDHEEHFECDCGISLDFPASQTVSRSQAADIAGHFFSNGKLPDSVRWVEG